MFVTHNNMPAELFILHSNISTSSANYNSYIYPTELKRTIISCTCTEMFQMHSSVAFVMFLINFYFPTERFMFIIYIELNICNSPQIPINQ